MSGEERRKKRAGAGAGALGTHERADQGGNRVLVRPSSSFPLPPSSSFAPETPDFSSPAPSICHRPRPAGPSGGRAASSPSRTTGHLPTSAPRAAGPLREAGPKAMKLFPGHVSKQFRPRELVGSAPTKAQRREHVLTRHDVLLPRSGETSLSPAVSVVVFSSHWREG